MVAGVEYRRARQEELPAICALWQAVFGDAPEEAEGYLRRFVGLENQFVAAEKTGPVAILSAVPCSCAASPGVYLFALGTSPAKRGRGLMAELMAYAEAECHAAGAAFACLIPAEASLFGYYQSRGYQSMQARALVYPAQQKPGAALRRVELNPVHLAEQRRCFLAGKWVDFAKKSAAEALLAARQAGWQLACSPGAYAVYQQKQEGLALPELGAESDEAAQALLEALCAETGQRQAVLTLPKASPLFAGQGTWWPLAAWKALDGGFSGTDAYLRFGLDEVFQKDFENLRLAFLHPPKTV